MHSDTTVLETTAPLPVAANSRLEIGSRVRSSTPIIGVQILRGLAAAAVVVHHAFEESEPLLGHALPRGVVLFGAAGVDLFFVISGFIMLHTSWGEFGSAGASGRFLRRRIARIFPLYWLCLGLVLAAWATGRLYRGLEITPKVVLMSALLLPTRPLVMGVSWTLVFEMYFYYLFAAWLHLRRQAAAVMALSLSLCGFALLAHVLPIEALRRYWGNPIVFEFTLGLLLAWLYRQGFTLAHRLWPALLAVAALLLASATAPSVGTVGLIPVARFFFWGIPAAVLVFSCLPLVTAKGPIARWLGQLGDASYALYLTHGFVMIVFARLIHQGIAARWMPASIWIIAVVVSCLLLGFVVHYWVERPLARRLRPYVR